MNISPLKFSFHPHIWSILQVRGHFLISGSQTAPVILNRIKKNYFAIPSCNLTVFCFAFLHNICFLSFRALLHIIIGKVNLSLLSKSERYVSIHCSVRICKYFLLVHILSTPAMYRCAKYIGVES